MNTIWSGSHSQVRGGAGRSASRGRGKHFGGFPENPVINRSPYKQYSPKSPIKSLCSGQKHEGKAKSQEEINKTYATLGSSTTNELHQSSSFYYLGAASSGESTPDKKMYPNKLKTESKDFSAQHEKEKRERCLNCTSTSRQYKNAITEIDYKERNLWIERQPRLKYDDKQKSTKTTGTTPITGTRNKDIAAEYNFSDGELRYSFKETSV
ncbi:uncharacterized protein LOC143459294 [Clavelina lepadiformis]|uniref:uncharacterized protein LOC143459294 n=1 Tax=Clavelina lepadiformis TaxID=159417 RepID=UPI0040411F34